MTSQSQSVISFNENDSLKLVGAYVPKEQPSKIAYIKLVQDKCMQIGDGKVATTEDLLSFMYACYRTGLDPVANQIHTQFRWDGKLGRHRMVVITGIDGFRLIAQRSKLYGGQDDSKFEVEELYNPVTNTVEKQLKASVTVYRINPKTGDRMAVTASARWNAYAQKFKEEYSGVWKANPHGMLAKCAEALALRKAFPQELSGLYTEDEISASEDTRKQLINELPTPKTILARKAPNAPQTTEYAETSNVSTEAKNNQESGKMTQKPVITNTPEDAQKRLQEILAKKRELEGGDTK